MKKIKSSYTKKWLNADTSALGVQLLMNGVVGKEKNKIKRWFFNTVLKHVDEAVKN